MSWSEDFRHGSRIARAEFARSIRRLLRDTRRVVGLGFAVLFFGGNLLFILPVVFGLGHSVQTVSAVPFFGPAATLLPVALLLTAVLRTIERIGGVDSEDLLLTAVHPRAVVIGLITAEIGRLLLWFGIPLAAIAVAFALGLGSLTILVTLGMILTPIVCCTAVWGYAVGIGTLRVFKRLPTVRRIVKVGSILVFLAFVILSQLAGQYLATRTVSFQTLLTVFSVTPLTDYVSLGFAGTSLARPVTPSALLILVGWFVLAPLGLVIAGRQAAALWFTDDTTHGGSIRSASSMQSATGLSASWPLSVTKEGRIAWGFLVRAVRHPQDLAHLLMLVFFLGPLAGSFFQSSPGDGFGILVAGAGVVLGVYLSGATFGLNPLGDDRPQLPLILLTETDPRTFLQGRIVAGLTVGLPLATVVPLATVAFGTPLISGLVFAGVGVGLSLAAALFALGVGCAYPIYEEREMWGAETVTPSTLVIMGYSVVVVTGSVIGLGIAWYGFTAYPSLTSIFLGGLGVYIFLTISIPFVSYRYAHRRYHRYMVD